MARKVKKGVYLRKLIFIVGLLICVYPFATRAINSILVHQEMARVTGDAQKQAERARKLAQANQGEIDLDIYGSGSIGKSLSAHLLGAIAIPAINVQLPLFDNVSDSALNHGAGVIPGTSAPIGGKSTHTAISAHSGLPTKTMFSDLDKLKRGDEFVIKVAGKHRAYKVDKIQVILPTDTTALKVQAGRDLATLVTCTPVPANTHRLLVTGHRVPYTQKMAKKVAVANKSGLWRNIVILAGIFWSLVTLCMYWWWRFKHRK